MRAIIMIGAFFFIGNAFAAEELIVNDKGCHVWNSELGMESVTWSGGCKDGYSEGMGILQWFNADKKPRIKYEGTIHNGKYHGKGEYKTADGMYNGDFVDGMRTGKGTFSWANGTVKDGYWYEDVFVTELEYKRKNDPDFDKNELAAAKRKAALKAKLEPLINKASSSYRCEEAKKLNGQLNSTDSIFNYESCVDDRNFHNNLNLRDPKKMYIAAGKYESTGERSRAKKIYLSIMDRFPDHAMAIKAIDRLTALRDVEAVEESNSNAAEAVKRSNERAAERAEAASRDAANAASRASSDARDLSKKACQDRQLACWRGCDQLRDSWSCKQGCPSCSY